MVGHSPTAARTLSSDVCSLRSALSSILSILSSTRSASAALPLPLSGRALGCMLRSRGVLVEGLWEESGHSKITQRRRRVSTTWDGERRGGRSSMPRRTRQ
eukprot:3804152-Rhodomonas_salina.1